MKKVAVLVALMGALALVPPSHAGDACSTNVGEGVACVAIPVQRPTSPPGVPNAPPVASTYFDTYYVWVGPGECLPSPVANACRGVPVAGGSGVPLPTGGAVGVGVFSLVYVESNEIPGLQREPINVGGSLRPADRTILI